MTTATLEAPTAALRIIPVQEVRANAASVPYGTLCSACHLKDLCLPCGLGGTGPSGGRWSTGS